MIHAGILAALAGQPWALDAAAFDVMAGVIQRWASGQMLSQDQIRLVIAGAPDAVAARRETAAQSSAGGVAVIPVFGTIAHRAHMVNQVSGTGGTSTEKLGAAIDAAANSNDVAAIVLDVDSPGGAIAGTPELVDRIYAARQSKPIVAVANATAASAAYWIASAASEFIVTPSGSVGSIGVLGVHEDRSAGLAAEGKKLTFIHAGKYKVEGNSAEPLSDEARATIQAMVDQAYGVMVRSIARNRGVSPDAVRSQYGEGRMFSAEDAMSRGMVDRVATLEETIARMGNPRRRSRLAAANNAVRIAAL
jgi:signal peptide peptidase SppA